MLGRHRIAGRGKAAMTEHRTTDAPTAAPDLVIDLRDSESPRTIVLDDPGAAPATRPAGVALLVALNLLNLLDAVLTHTLTSGGVAREGNPVVEWMTLPGKVVFVAALSVVLWKLRPGALVVPVVAYVAIVCYTLVGAAVSA
jgi:hypothetical protein